MHEPDNFKAAVTTNGSAFRSRRVINAMPVELLRDQRGIYGIGVSDEYDIEVPALERGIVDASGVCVPRILSLRPDHVDGVLSWWEHPRTAALQRILAGDRGGIFSNTTEEGFRQIIHHEALKRAGLTWLAYGREPWWSRDKLLQDQNRRMYYGLRLFSLSAINRMIGQLIEEAADRDALQVARRFALHYRENIYRAATSHHCILQLADTFPLLALATCANFYGAFDRPSLGWSELEVWETDLKAKAATAVRLAKRGARLREVAAALEIPMALRHVKPGVAHLVTPLLVRHPEFLQWMPNETATARIWLTLVGYAGRRDVDYARWVARHASEMPGRLQQAGHMTSDIWDWASANTQESMGQLVTRRFTPSMGLSTAIKASHEWHEAVASHMDAAGDLALPPPWYPPAAQGGFDIVPLTTSADVYREGHAMHHCVATYVEQVRQGTSYIFSVRRDGKRIATISLSCHNETISIQQLRGSCNTAPPKAVSAAVRKWLHAQRTTAAAIRQRYEEWSCATQVTRQQTLARATPDDFDDIQF